MATRITCDKCFSTYSDTNPIFKVKITQKGFSTPQEGSETVRVHKDFCKECLDYLVEHALRIPPIQVT